MNSVDFSKIARTTSEPVHKELVSEWGGVVEFRVLSAAERFELLNSGWTGAKIAVEAAARTIIDPTGQAAHVIRNADASNEAVISRLAMLAWELNGLGKEPEGKKS